MILDVTGTCLTEKSLCLCVPINYIERNMKIIAKHQKRHFLIYVILVLAFLLVTLNSLMYEEKNKE